MTVQNVVFFRNDDVDVFKPGLQEMTDEFIKRGIPLSHAVVPYRLSKDTVSWL